MDAWRVEIRVATGQPDPDGTAAAAALAAAGAADLGPIRSVRGYLLGADLPREAVERFAADALADPVLQAWELHAPGDVAPDDAGRVCVVPKPGVTDPVAQSLRKALADAGHADVRTGTYRSYEFAAADAAERVAAAAAQGLANDVIHDVLVNAVPTTLPGAGASPDLAVVVVPVRGRSEAELVALSRDGGLALNAGEMQTVAAHFAELGREPTRLELETIAQTWSEHCKHKTLTGRIRYVEGDAPPRDIDNLLRSTIAHVTATLDRDFCVSVFEDNAGIIAFDDDDCVCIKVETHNHPSAIEPFGGAGTGVGGVIRDVLGTGLGARPIANTDVFCLAPPDTATDALPKGCLHPLRVLRGVVAGVRDYGNPMGIPTVNGAVHFDPDFVGNPLVYVGNVGILPRARAFKKANPGDTILAVGGRTGRDGIHGATFSSLELHTESETVSSGAVQIGDPIAERKVMDAILRMADEDLFSAITDCGAGGFSSAVGEMADGLGADVELADAPLKYGGLAPWEIWVSEAQERMVLAVAPDRLARALEVCDEESVEATSIGTFNDSGRLVIRYAGEQHGDLDLEFLHRGVPRAQRQAVYTAERHTDPELGPEPDLGQALLGVLGDPNVASKEWIIRQYDHEVQAGSAGKPLVGVRNDGPADAAVIAPKLGSRRGLVLGCGLNPRYSKIDPAAMAECALDEAMRNIVAAGGDPDQTAILDNYCWGNTALPDRLGGLVRASLALTDLALVYRTPFVSGKDSLNNEFRDGERTIAIPGCILVTALSVIPDVSRTLTSDFKRAGHRLFLVGITKRELGGSVYWKNRDALGASVPRVDATLGHRVLEGVWRAIQARAVVAAHDLAEGGLGAAAAEMAIGGRLGARLDLAQVPLGEPTPSLGDRPEDVLFSESQSRILLEVPPDRVDDLRENLGDAPVAEIGEVLSEPTLRLEAGGRTLTALPIDDLARAWKAPLDLDGTLEGAR
ncbi:MAG: phosphoribosylformylglycinamidine synthase subunit PurL [Planctomycetota bacterium]